MVGCKGGEEGKKGGEKRREGKHEGTARRRVLARLLRVALLRCYWGYHSDSKHETCDYACVCGCAGPQPPCAVYS